jgi:predicted flap endonuclease-1-like 5' DNA nuclease
MVLLIMIIYLQVYSIVTGWDEIEDRRQKMTKIAEIEGIGPAIAGKLAKAEILTVEKLLVTCATAKGRGEVAKKTGLNKADLLLWANHADLFRIKGVGSEYSQLLEVAGVDTVVELAQRKAPNLVKKMEEVNVKKKLVRRTPTEKMVEKWIAQAKKLPKVVAH